MPNTKDIAVRKAIDVLKREAKPGADRQVVKDHGGFLYAFSHQNGRLELAQIQDEQKRPSLRRLIQRKITTAGAV